MNLDGLEGFNEIRSPVYRTAVKLQHLQKHLCMDTVVLMVISRGHGGVDGLSRDTVVLMVYLQRTRGHSGVDGLSPVDTVFCQHVTKALPQRQEVSLDRQEVTRALNRMFRSVGQEVLGHVTLEETCSMMFGINDRSGSGFISSASLQTSLIALSAETLHRKYTALIGVAVQRGSASISRSGLRALLQDLSQVPAALQEDGAFGQVEAARRTRVVMATGEPPLLLWLPTLHRLSVSQDVRHDVRCHTCKTRPFTGLRYRSHLEGVSVLVSTQRSLHAVATETDPERGRQEAGPGWAEPQDSAPPPSEDSVSQNASVHPPTSSKALQTEEEPTQLKASVLLTEVRNLQRDKW
ncbi:Dystrotelin [Dissostichus eleginoides]|uniref:Dystrotelin n=1 Tax=Dissostichus eleginoides TaxID=100907 RepID=A0AAD9B317_DISEL|nr:Dystrotelin [Dissostichus eleginoides]